MEQPQAERQNSTAGEIQQKPRWESPVVEVSRVIETETGPNVSEDTVFGS